MSDSVTPNSGHVCVNYRRDLHLAISECSGDVARATNQAATALEAGRSEEIDQLELNGKPAKIEDLKWAADILIDRRQMPDLVQNLFEKTDSAIRTEIIETEKFLLRIQKVLKGVKIPERPIEVDAWIEK